MFILIFFSFFTIIISTTQVCYFQDEREINNKIFKIIYKKAPDESIDRYIDNKKVSDEDYFDFLLSETLNEEETKIKNFNQRCEHFSFENKKIQRKAALKIFNIIIKNITEQFFLLNSPQLKNFIDFSVNITEEDFKEINFLVNQTINILNQDPNLDRFNVEQITKLSDLLERLYNDLSVIILETKKRAIELSDDTKHLKQLLEI